MRRDYPPALELIVMRALEKRPADRYQSAEEMRNDLEEFLDESGFRTGPRRMAIYLKQLFAPDAPVTEDGVAQARQLAEADSEPKVIAADESEELNFDRRASFSMRVEAAPATPRQSPASPLAAPLAFAAASARPRAAGRPEQGPEAGLPPTSVSELPAGAAASRDPVRAAGRHARRRPVGSRSRRPLPSARNRSRRWRPAASGPGPPAAG